MADWRTAVTAALGEPVQTAEPLSGGSIAETRLVTLASGRRIVVKTCAGHPGMFQAEAAGLRELALAQALPVPAVLAADEGFIALAHIESGPRQADYDAQFGRGFAALHRHQSEQFGLAIDNYIGATPQRNTPRPAAAGWAGFYWEQRLEFQLRLAERQGRSTPELTGMMAVLEDRLPALLAGSEEPPCLLHGDLWSGNVMTGPDGYAVIIDPAVYYGHREADLAMTTLFGGFSPAFYAAYQEAWPLADGWQRREPVYQLYHLLNHLNLFGSGYLGQCLSATRACLR